MIVRVLHNYVATMFFLGASLAFYCSFSNYHHAQFSSDWTPTFFGYVSLVTFTTSHVLTALFVVYAIFLLPYYWYTGVQATRAMICYRYLADVWRFGRFRSVQVAEHQAFLSLLLKFFFVPFIVDASIGHFAGLNNMLLSAHQVLNSGEGYLFTFDRLLHPLLMNLIFLFDLVPFFVGYLVDVPLLRNKLISVESTLLGWVVCLACYPPFNGAVGDFLSFTTGDFSNWGPSFPVLHIVSNLALLVLFGLYASVSVSLGWKASNLTSRGVVQTGLYRYIRHPAYVCKNAAWWVAAIPVFYHQFQTSAYVACMSMLCLAGWTSIYVMRAITEERHLLRSDPVYAEYCKLVPRQFLPALSRPRRGNVSCPVDGTVMQLVRPVDDRSVVVAA